MLHRPGTVSGRRARGSRPEGPQDHSGGPDTGSAPTYQPGLYAVGGRTGECLLPPDRVVHSRPQVTLHCRSWDSGCQTSRATRCRRCSAFQSDWNYRQTNRQGHRRTCLTSPEASCRRGSARLPTSTPSSNAPVTALTTLGQRQLPPLSPTRPFVSLPMAQGTASRASRSREGAVLPVGPERSELPPFGAQFTGICPKRPTGPHLPVESRSTCTPESVRWLAFRATGCATRTQTRWPNSKVTPAAT